MLLDPDRAYHRAVAVCAEAVPNEDPPEDLDSWTLAKLDLAIQHGRGLFWLTAP